MSLSRHVSMLLKGSLALTALVAAGSLMAEPADAQAAIRGAGVIVRPSGSSQSLAIEVEAPIGGYWDGEGAVVTPVYTTPGTNQEAFTTLTVDGGLFTAPTPASSSTNPILNSVAAQIDAQTFTTVEDLATLIRATTGFDGLD